MTDKETQEMETLLALPGNERLRELTYKFSNHITETQTLGLENLKASISMIQAADSIFVEQLKTKKGQWPKVKAWQDLKKKILK